MLEDKKRIIFYIADNQGCGFFRMVMPSLYIEKYGFEYVRTSVVIPEDKYWVSSGNNKGICVLQRQYSEKNYEIAVKMKNSGIKIIFEIDDYVHDIDKNSPVYNTYNPSSPVHNTMKKFYKLADAITVTTEPLRQKLLQYNKNIHVIPNSFILKDWDLNKQKHKSINIMWSGSSTHYSDLSKSGAAEAVIQILKEHKNTKLITAGWDCAELFKSIPLHQKIHHKWTPNIRAIGNFYRMADIGIAPIVQSDFNECKSENKWVEYSLSGMATIATKFGPYENKIKNNEDGILVKNRFDKWYKAIERLVLDEGLRVSISENSKKRCINEYDIEKNIENWVNVYNKIIES